MILQSLVELYERRAGRGDVNEQPAEVGFEKKEIPFLIEIDADGRFIQIRDVRQGEGRARRAKARIVPRGEKKASGVKANLLWDTAEYVLGCPVELKGKKSKPDRLREQHEAFRQRIEALPGAARGDAGVNAVLAFLDALNLDQMAMDPLWEEIRTSNPLMSFVLAGDSALICQRRSVVEAHRSLDSASEADGLCLVSGKPSAIARLHPAIKGVLGAQTSGANIVSFNQKAFKSYNKSQGANAPISSDAANKYTTALNDLLSRDSRQRAQVGDATMVFWSERGSAMEDGDFLSLLGIAQEDDPAAHADRIAHLYASVRSGRYSSHPDATQRFYVLGLAPNAARLSVRFWQVDTIGGVAGRFARWFEDIAIVPSAKQPDVLPILPMTRLLRACALQEKLDKLPPSLGGDIMRSILAGTPYPQSWLQAALRRCRAEQSVDHPRAAILKACLNRTTTEDKEKLAVSLDPDHPNVAYRLGRLFAVFERIQEEASPGLSATVRDRYFGAASTNPLAVFPTLNRLKNHHLAKLSNRGRAQNLEKLVGTIVDGLPADAPFPPHLALADQGRFAVGYYHQRHNSSTYRNTNESENTP